jgi:hypothetical protein
MMNLDEVSKLAVHEAGHAVMHIFLRLDNLDTVSLLPKGGSAGRISVRMGAEMLIAEEQGSSAWPRVRRARIARRKWLFVVMAGPHATWSPPTHTDLRQIKDLSRAIGGKQHKEVRACLDGRCTRLVRLLSPVIFQFAKLLDVRREIEGREASEIISEMLGITDYWRLDLASRYSPLPNADL